MVKRYRVTMCVDQVNHQYDKSSFFLQAAKSYVQRYVHSGLQISSPISHMWDLEVAKVFCTHPMLIPFHSVFLSCNEPIDHTRWCATCEKCAFVFLLMSAFLPPPQVWAVFGDNLFEKRALANTFLALIGRADVKDAKPFECVGTFGEAKAAVELSCWQWVKYGTILASIPSNGWSLDSPHKSNGALCHVPRVPPVLQILSAEIGLVFYDEPLGPNMRCIRDMSLFDNEDIAIDTVISRWTLVETAQDRWRPLRLL